MNRRHFALLSTLTLAVVSLVGPALAASPTPRGNGLSNPGLFAVLDSDHDGVLSPAEQANAAIVLRALDTDEDGVITAAELTGPKRNSAARRGSRGLPVSSSVRPVSDLYLLAHLDANHDGEIQPLEVSNAAASLRDLDVNQDGVVTRSEV